MIEAEKEECAGSVDQWLNRVMVAHQQDPEANALERPTALAYSGRVVPK